MTDSPAYPESTLVEGAISLERVFRQEYSYVFHSLRRLGVSERELDDVAQDVFLTVAAILPDYDPERPLRPWLFGITYRHALRHRGRARHRREQLESSPGVDQEARGGTEEVAERRERQALVITALQSVAESRRGVVIMSDIEGRTAPEISEALGLAVNTVYSRLRIGRSEFKDAILRLSSKGTR